MEYSRGGFDVEITAAANRSKRGMPRCLTETIKLTELTQEHRSSSCLSNTAHTPLVFTIGR